jgi:hypothetical protein
VKSICSNAESEMQIANISRGGALLRSRWPLVPRTKVQLEFVIPGGVIQLAGFVLRSSISSPRGMPRFQTAVAFDRPLQILDYQPPPMVHTSQASAFSAAIASVSICNVLDAAQCELLKLNDW